VARSPFRVNSTKCEDEGEGRGEYFSQPIHFQAEDCNLMNADVQNNVVDELLEFHFFDAEIFVLKDKGWMGIGWVGCLFLPCQCECVQ